MDLQPDTFARGTRHETRAQTGRPDLPAGPLLLGDAAAIGATIPHTSRPSVPSGIRMSRILFVGEWIVDDVDNSSSILPPQAQLVPVPRPH